MFPLILNTVYPPSDFSGFFLESFTSNISSSVSPVIATISSGFLVLELYKITKYTKIKLKRRIINYARKQ